MQILESTYGADLVCGTTEEFNGDEGGIWLCGEGGQLDRNNMRIFHYYNDDFEGAHYTFGVRNHLHRWAERAGWFFEWYDAGTIMLYPA